MIGRTCTRPFAFHCGESFVVRTQRQDGTDTDRLAVGADDSSLLSDFVPSLSLSFVAILPSVCVCRHSILFYVVVIIVTATIIIIIVGHQYPCILSHGTSGVVDPYGAFPRPELVRDSNGLLSCAATRRVAAVAATTTDTLLKQVNDSRGRRRVMIRQLTPPPPSLRRR